jgi:hypothetical protein
MRSRIEKLEKSTHKEKWQWEDVKIMVWGTREQVDMQIAEEIENRKKLGIDKDPNVPDCIGLILDDTSGDERRKDKQDSADRGVNGRDKKTKTGS